LYNSSVYQQTPAVEAVLNSLMGKLPTQSLPRVWTETRVDSVASQLDPSQVLVTRFKINMLGAHISTCLPHEMLIDEVFLLLCVSYICLIFVFVVGSELSVATNDS
jgi:hypothetical protein